ncbi:phage tail protein [bacterium (Candidatus Blackallbacteria) CG18_big_fil_WC_8_21_14_2_50_49_26]|nr:MAG: phage tail protein [bacterium (Candidatus Blackallbacteria) CG18_big_fil_WC_8_21_14_2_50_49_26]
MSTVRKWSNVAIAMQSALAAADIITSITKANPGVATSVAHGMNNGDYVLLSIQGMHQLNDRVARIANKTVDTFELEGIDTTLFDTFSSGTSEALTFGTSITSATSVSASGGGFDFIDTTTIHSNAKTQIPGLPAAATFSFENIWDVADAGLLAMKTASDAQAKRAFKFTFGTGGQIMVFAGYVGANLLPGGSAQGLVTTSTVITMNGTPSYLAS